MHFHNFRPRAPRKVLLHYTVLRQFRELTPAAKAQQLASPHFESVPPFATFLLKVEWELQ